MPNKINIACMMIQKDEEFLLEHWIIYHGELFGYENLYIWDNGSKNLNVLNLIEKWTDRDVNFFDGAKSEIRYRDKGGLFSRKIRSLERFGYYDFYLPLDCDEFFALKSDDNFIETDREKILSAFNTLSSDDHIFEVNYNYPNNLIDRMSFFGWKFNKRFARKGVFGEMDHGGHSIAPRERCNMAVSPFAYIHYCYRPFDDMRKSAVSKLILNPEVSQLSDDEKLLHRLAKYTIMDEATYIKELEVLNSKLLKYKSPSLQQFFQRFSRRLPYD